MKSILIVAQWLAAVATPWLAPTGAHGMPVISEVFYDAVGSDDGQSFVELWGEPGTPLDGLVLEGVNGSNGAVGPSVDLSGVIPAEGLFVIADVRSDGSTDVLVADQLANFDFQNGPDSVVLRDADLVLDAVGYGEFAPDEIFAGEGSPAPDGPSGSSLARFFADLDRDDNSIDFLVIAEPTPGQAPLQTVPEPGAFALAVSGLAGLGVVARSRRRP